MKRYSIYSAVLLTLCLAACSKRVTSYPAKVLEGSPFPIERAPELATGMTPKQVRDILGAPFEEHGDGKSKTWRYYTRMLPAWSDGGDSSRQRPESSVEAEASVSFEN